MNLVLLHTPSRFEVKASWGPILVTERPRASHTELYVHHGTLKSKRNMEPLLWPSLSLKGFEENYGFFYTCGM
jgi:hypothetical protein